MKVHDEHEFGGIGRRAALICAALGLITAALMVFAMGGRLSAALPVEILVGILALFVGSAFLGKWAGKMFSRYAPVRVTDAIIGLLVAFGSIVISVFTASLFYFLKNLTQFNRSGNFWLSFVAPQVAVLLVGGIPAMFLGILFGVLVRREFSKAGY